MVFIGHFLILLVFILLLYLLANYSSLRYEAKELAMLWDSLKGPLEPQQIKYYSSLYRENREAYQRRKASVFSKVLILFFKDLDQNFPTL